MWALAPAVLLALGSGLEQWLWKHSHHGDPSTAVPCFSARGREGSCPCPCPGALRMVSSCLGLSWESAWFAGRGLPGSPVQPAPPQPPEIQRLALVSPKDTGTFFRVQG